MHMSETTPMTNLVESTQGDILSQDGSSLVVDYQLGALLAEYNGRERTTREKRVRLWSIPILVLLYLLLIAFFVFLGWAISTGLTSFTQQFADMFSSLPGALEVIGIILLYVGLIGFFGYLPLN